MHACKPIHASPAALAVLLAALAVLLPAPALAAAGTSPMARKVILAPRALRVSRELWATIDVCRPADQPNTVGIRGSMPGDGHARDTMYMSFRLQYMNTTTNRWVDLSKTVPAFVAVGAARTARQGGTSFELKPVTGQSAFTMRGVVDFQWRHGPAVVASLSRPTTAGHQSLAGADPAGFTAATCLIG
ncbi:MAG: hypothetical protein ACHQAV_04170 [Solirubrobacterales bacterium]